MLNIYSPLSSLWTVQAPDQVDVVETIGQTYSVHIIIGIGKQQQRWVRPSATGLELFHFN